MRPCGNKPRQVSGLDHRSMLLVTRFWSRVHRVDGQACWPWLGATSGDGYGVFRVGSRVVYAHRFAWLATYGPLPEDLLVLHRCDNTLCARPDHYFLGTYSDNNRDRAAKGRHVGERQEPRILSARATRRLTATEIFQIRKLFASGAYTKTFLAAQYGVDRTTVRHALGERPPDRPSNRPRASASRMIPAAGTVSTLSEPQKVAYA